MTQPTQQEKLIIAAKADGWIDINVNYELMDLPVLCGFNPTSKEMEALPQYDKDDNAMRRLLNLMTDKEWWLFCNILKKILNIHSEEKLSVKVAMQSPISDQFEAWGKAKGKW